MAKITRHEAYEQGFGPEVRELDGLHTERFFSGMFALFFTAADVGLWVAHDPYPWWGLMLWHIFCIGVAGVCWFVAGSAAWELRQIKRASS
jgi:hypothetical protein